MSVVPADIPRKRWTAEAYLDLVELGAFGPEDRVELLDGELVEMSPQSPAHSNTAGDLAQQLFAAYGPGYRIRTHSPIVAGETSVPEPDVAVARGGVGEFRGRHPGAGDLVLVVEVSQTSRHRDRAKAEIYASVGVPVYWLVDLEAGHIEVYTEPLDTGRYGTSVTRRRGDEIELPEVSASIAVDDVLGPTPAS